MRALRLQNAAFSTINCLATRRAQRSKASEGLPRRPRRKGRSGGQALHSGADFQNRVAAWVAGRILAERDAPGAFGLGAEITLERIHCETPEQIDDALVTSSEGGRVWIQSKSHLSLSSAKGSQLADALDQFVAQLKAMASRGQQLHPRKDRFVIATDQGGEAIETHLGQVLEGARKLLPGEPLEEIAKTDGERRALAVVKGHLDRSWGAPIPEPEFRTLLASMRIDVFRLADGGAAMLALEDLINKSVVESGAARNAISELYRNTARLAALGAGADRDALKRVLVDANVRLRPTPSYESDIAALKQVTKRSVAELREQAAIALIDGEKVQLDRAVAAELNHSADAGSLLLVGDPGVGKSGLLHSLASSRLATGRAVVVLTAATLDSTSVNRLRQELALQHDVADILAGWNALEPGTLIIDALDAARGSGVSRALIDLIREVRRKAPSWVVVASIRRYDLREGVAVRPLFPVDPSSRVPVELTEQIFGNVRHISVSSLAEDELVELAGRVPRMAALLSSATPELRRLLVNLFNFRLAYELLATGVPPDELATVRTQLGLLDRYWEQRIAGDDQTLSREDVLRKTCVRMIERRRLRIPALDLGLSGVELTTLAELERRNVVNQEPGAGGQQLLGFGHQILFDYAVSRLVLPYDAGELAQKLLDEPTLALVVRPSLVLLFNRLWDADSDGVAFWNAVLAVSATTVTEVAKVVGPSVAADRARALEDLNPLLSVLASDGATRDAAVNALRHVFGTLYARGEDLAGERAALWSAVAEETSKSVV